MRSTCRQVSGTSSYSSAGLDHHRERTYSACRRLTSMPLATADVGSTISYYQAVCCAGSVPPAAPSRRLTTRDYFEAVCGSSNAGSGDATSTQLLPAGNAAGSQSAAGQQQAAQVEQPTPAPVLWHLHLPEDVLGFSCWANSQKQVSSSSSAAGVVAAGPAVPTFYQEPLFLQDLGHIRCMLSQHKDAAGA
jgi:hypothetical protein